MADPAHDRRCWLANRLRDRLALRIPLPACLLAYACLLMLACLLMAISWALLKILPCPCAIALYGAPMGSYGHPGDAVRTHAREKISQNTAGTRLNPSRIAFLAEMDNSYQRALRTRLRGLKRVSWGFSCNGLPEGSKGHGTWIWDFPKIRKKTYAII